MSIDLYNEINAPELIGKDIVLPEYSALYLSERSKLFAFTGIYIKDSDRGIHFESWPYYLAGKHTKNLDKYMNGLFRVENGCILISAFLDYEIYADKKYKRLTDYFIKMPVANDCYFGVVKREEYEFIENEELSRQCFGLTYSELSYFLEVYAQKIEY